VLLVGKGAQAAASKVTLSRSAGVQVIRDGSVEPAQFVVMGKDGNYAATLFMIGVSGHKVQFELHDMSLGKKSDQQVTVAANGSATVTMNGPGPFLIRKVP